MSLSRSSFARAALFVITFFFGLLQLVEAATESEGKTSGRVLDRVLVSIDGDAVTLADLRRFQSSRGESNVESYDISEPATKSALEELVIDGLLQREARNLGVGVSQEEVSSYIQEIMNQNRVDENGLKQLLSDRGITFADYRYQVERDILKSRVVGMRVRSRVKLLDSEVEDYIRQNAKRFRFSAAHKVEQLFVPVNEEQNVELSRKIAEGLHRNAIRHPRRFSRLYPEGYTDLGAIRPQDLRAELAEALALIDDGEVTDIIETPEGLFILKLEIDPIESAAIPESLLEDARKELSQTKFQEVLDDYLKVELPKKYHVEYRHVSLGK